MPAMRAKYEAPDIFQGFPEWEELTFYANQEIVEYAGSMWQATRQINPEEEIFPNDCNGPCPPNKIYDIDGDVINDNPWKQLYPWRDGDYIIVTPDKWYRDGDSWTADLSLLGLQGDLLQSDLDSILVKPNPYVVSSAYNEDIYGNRLLFDKLPAQCTIKIYTVIY